MHPFHLLLKFSKIPFWIKKLSVFISQSSKTLRMVIYESFCFRVSDILIQVEGRGRRICRGVVVSEGVPERKGCIGRSCVMCCQHWPPGVYSPCVYVHIHVHSRMPEHPCIHIHITTHTLMDHAWISLSQRDCRKKDGTLVTGQMGNKNKGT